ncbi:MAG: FGGY-family carbohydrate kinase [Thermofilum sp.]
MHSKELILTIDVGTTNAKAAVFHESGRLLAVEGYEYPTHFPRPGWAEQDPEDWWSYAVLAARDAIKRARATPDAFIGVAVSSQRETLAFIDREGRSLGRVPTWMDRRSLPQAEEIKRRLGVKEVYERTGLIVDATFTATKLLWFKENCRELLERAWIGLQPKDYIVYKLTGVAVTDETVASRTMLFNIRERRWDEKLISELGLSDYAYILPEVKRSWEVVGGVKEDSARLIGVAPGTPVLAGTGDRTAEVLGAGILGPEKAEESTGTGSTTATMVPQPLLDPRMRFSVGVAPIPSRWVVEAGISTAGAILRWFRDHATEGVDYLASRTRRRAYEFFDLEAEYVPPGSGGVLVLPFFSGARSPRWNPYARGVIFGLTVFHTRAHLFRAMMEGVAYELRKILESFEEIGIKPRELVLMGGGAKTPTWARIKANVTNREVIIPELLDAALGGDAVLVAYSAGACKSFEEAVSRFFRERVRLKPDPELVKIYEKYYAIYEKLYTSVENLFKEISEISEPPVAQPPWDIENLTHLLFKLES